MTDPTKAILDGPSTGPKLLEDQRAVSVPEPATHHPRITRWLHRLAAVVLAAILVFAVRHLLHEYDIHDIAREFAAIPGWRISISLGLMLCGYATLSVYDQLATGYVGARLKYWQVSLASFIAYAFSHSLGFATVTSTAIRYRLYARWGVSPADVGRIILFVSATFFVGMFALGGTALVVERLALPRHVHLPGHSTKLVGILLWLLLLAYLGWVIRGKPRLKIHAWIVEPPSLSVAVVQIIVSSLDWALAGAVMYVLLPPAQGLTIWKFLGVFLVAQSIGILSHVPGGLGVFETLMVYMLSRFLDGPRVLGALVAYRVIYYLIPLVSAAVLFAVYEVGRRKWRQQHPLPIDTRELPR